MITGKTGKRNRDCRHVRSMYNILSVFSKILRNLQIDCCMEWLTDLRFCLNRKLIPIKTTFLPAGNEASIFIFTDYHVCISIVLMSLQEWASANHPESSSVINHHQSTSIIIIVNHHYRHHHHRQPSPSIIIIINHHHHYHHQSLSSSIITIIVNHHHQSSSSLPSIIIIIIIIIVVNYHHQSSIIIIKHDQSSLSSSSSSSSKLCFGWLCHNYHFYYLHL